MRILIVEDEKRLAGTLAELLHRRGYTVDVSYDGVSGLDNARSGIYDLVLLDAMLPGLDGFSLLQQLRAGGEHGAGADADGPQRPQRPGAGSGLRRGLLPDQAL